MSPDLVDMFREIHPASKRYFRQQIKHWYARHCRSFPWRQTRSAYEVLVAEIMLQQTNAALVMTVYAEFVKRFPTPEALAESEQSTVERMIRGIGLKYRAERLTKIAESLAGDFGGKVPDTKEELISLPGVGRYIAGAVLSNAFNRRSEILDSNIVRIIGRYFGLYSTKSRPYTDPQLWAIARLLLPREEANCRDWNFALLDFCARFCTHYNPSCIDCPCVSKCVYASTSAGEVTTSSANISGGSSPAITRSSFPNSSLIPT